MTPVCDLCDRYIEVSNHRFPGYCSPRCRNSARGHGTARGDWNHEIARAVAHLHDRTVAPGSTVDDLAALALAEFPNLPPTVAAVAANRVLGRSPARATAAPSRPLVLLEDVLRARGVPSKAVDLRKLDLPRNRRDPAA